VFVLSVLGHLRGVERAGRGHVCLSAQAYQLTPPVNKSEVRSHDRASSGVSHESFVAF
jgi:hypothetical protein